MRAAVRASMDLARPLRERLAGRSLLSTVLTCLLVPAAAWAQTVPPVLDACSTEPDGGKRLACYDREIARLHKLAPNSASALTPTPASARAPALTPTPAPVPATALDAGPASASARGAALTPGASAPAAPPPASPEARFGMTEALKRQAGTQPPELNNLTGRISGVVQKAREEVRLTLENGQIWDQAEPQAHLVLAPGDTVTIHRGLLGAFYLSSDKVRGLRVRRLR